MRRHPRKLRRRMEEQAGVVQPELSDRLKAALADAEPVLRRRAARLCADTGDGDDLLQDTLERALRQGIPVEVRSPLAWLTTIMYRLFLDRCRAAARQPKAEVLEDAHGTVAPLELDAPEPPWAEISIEDVRAALEQIEPVYRDAYRMHEFELQAYEQIAQKLSIERVTVGTRLTRARNRLREVLVKRFGLEDKP